MMAAFFVFVYEKAEILEMLSVLGADGIHHLHERLGRSLKVQGVEPIDTAIETMHERQAVTEVDPFDIINYLEELRSADVYIEADQFAPLDSVRAVLRMGVAELEQLVRDLPYDSTQPDHTHGWTLSLAGNAAEDVGFSDAGGSLVAPVGSVSRDETDEAKLSASLAFYEMRNSLPLNSSLLRSENAPGDELLHRLASAFFTSMFDKPNLAVLGDKMPLSCHWRHLDLVRRFFPRLKMVFIVRHPLDVVNSSLARRSAAQKGQDCWHITTIEQACREWYLAWRDMLDSRAKWPDDVLVIEYDAFCADIPASFAKICDFVGLQHVVGELATAVLPGHMRRMFLNPQDLAYAESYFADAIVAKDAHDLVGWLDSGITCAAPYWIGAPVTFGDGQGDAYVLEGFRTTPEGVIVNDEVATLAFRLGRCPGEIHLEIDLIAASRDQAAQVGIGINREPPIFYSCAQTTIHAAIDVRSDLLEIRFSRGGEAAAEDPEFEVGLKGFRILF